MSTKENNKRLYIGNLDESMNEYAIMSLFKPFGKIMFIEVMIHHTGDKKGLPRGFCFLELETKEQALKAIEKLHGKSIRGKSLVVSFANKTPTQDDVKRKRQNTNPTCISLIKRQRMKNASTDEKIKAIETKLEALKHLDTVNKKDTYAYIKKI